MDLPIILDAAVLVILLFFVVRGIQHGFVRAFCSFLALFVAFFGALVISKQVTPIATEFFAPQFLPSIVSQLEKDSGPTPSQDPSAQETALLLKKIGLPESWSRIIQQDSASSDRDQNATGSPSQILAGYILSIIISAALFILSFFLLLLLWAILSRSLDLVARLPVLSFFNRILGALFGLCKALIFLLVLRWVLCDLTGQISPELLEQTRAFALLSALFAHVQLPSSLLGFHQISWR